MTEEIMKECKNCDALGIDSDIGVYYCCLSHRQDDLPKEFTCEYFIPNKQLLLLEQENKELKEENKQHIKEKQILHERLYCYAYEKGCHLVCKQQNCLLKNSYVYRSALEEIREIAENAKEGRYTTKSEDYTEGMHTIGCYVLNEINEVLNESK